MDRLNFEGLKRKLDEREFLIIIGQTAKANYSLAQTYFSLHASGFADWHENLRAALETGSLAMAETLGPQIEDPELRRAFYALLEHTRELVEIDQQIVMWLTGFADVAIMRDKPDRNKLNQRLHRIAVERSEGPQGPVWAMRPEYQVLEEKSKQAMAAATRAREQFGQRFRQLLETADEVKL